MSNANDYLIYFSMGGAVAVHVAQKRAIPSFAGLVVVDVVEGTFSTSAFPYICIEFIYLWTRNSPFNSYFFSILPFVHFL